MEINLGKIVAIGIYNSSVAVKNKTVTANRKTTMFEIELPIESGGISYIDKESIQIEPDMIICAKPGQTRHTKLPFKCYYIHVIINGGLLEKALSEAPDFIKIENRKKYENIFKQLLMHYDSALETEEIMLHSLILEIIFNILSDSKKSELNKNVKSAESKIINDAVKYVKDNLSAKLSLKDVASHFGFSPIYFHNFFKSATGKTLRDYIESERIKKAANMIVATDFTLTQIAYECGFSSQSYFSYAFKRRMNLTPREYAKNVFKRYDIT